MHLVIADAGPLIALARIGSLDLLRQVFGAVVLTSVVANEIGIQGSPDAAAARVDVGAIGEALAAGWLTIANAGVEGSYQPLNPGVDAGECSTIALALLRQADAEKVLVILDDLRQSRSQEPGTRHHRHGRRPGVGQGTESDFCLCASAGRPARAGILPQRWLGGRGAG